MTECDCGDCDVCSAYWEDTFPDDDRTDSDTSSSNWDDEKCIDCGETDCGGYCPEREERIQKEEEEDLKKQFKQLSEEIREKFGDDTKL